MRYKAVRNMGWNANVRGDWVVIDEAGTSYGGFDLASVAQAYADSLNGTMGKLLSGLGL